MEQNFAELSQFIMVPAVLVLLAVFLCAILVVQGLSLRASVNLVDAGPIGFLYATFVSVIMSICGCIVSTMMVIVFKDANQWVLACYSATTGIVVLALLVRCHPLKAFCAYICHLFFSTIGCIVITIALVIFLVIGAKTNAINLPDKAPDMMGNIRSGWSDETSVNHTSGFSPAVGGGNVQSNPFSS